MVELCNISLLTHTNIFDYKDIMPKDLQQALENLHDEIESETDD